MSKNLMTQLDEAGKEAVKQAILEAIKEDEREYCFDRGYCEDESWEAMHGSETREQAYARAVSVCEGLTLEELFNDFGDKYEHILQSFSASLKGLMSQISTKNTEITALRAQLEAAEMQKRSLLTEAITESKKTTAIGPSVEISYVRELLWDSELVGDDKHGYVEEIRQAAFVFNESTDPFIVTMDASFKVSMPAMTNRQKLEVLEEVYMHIEDNYHVGLAQEDRFNDELTALYAKVEVESASSREEIGEETNMSNEEKYKSVLKELLTYNIGEAYKEIILEVLEETPQEAWNLEVQTQYSDADNDWEVNVWDAENKERVEDLERVFVTEEDALEYVESLVKDKRYIVTHI